MGLPVVIGVSLCPVFPFRLLAASLRPHAAVSRRQRCRGGHRQRQTSDVQYRVSPSRSSEMLSITHRRSHSHAHVEEKVAQCKSSGVDCFPMTPPPKVQIISTLLFLFSSLMDPWRGVITDIHHSMYLFFFISFDLFIFFKRMADTKRSLNTNGKKKILNGAVIKRTSRSEVRKCSESSGFHLRVSPPEVRTCLVLVTARRWVFTIIAKEFLLVRESNLSRRVHA